jgi:hypothetical protein
MLYESQHKLHYHATGQYTYETTNSVYHHACYITSTVMIGKNNALMCYFGATLNILVIILTQLNNKSNNKPIKNAILSCLYLDISQVDHMISN